MKVSSPRVAVPVIHTKTLLQWYFIIVKSLRFILSLFYSGYLAVTLTHMLKVLLYTFLFSILPFGEARLGIPYAVFNNVHFLLAFAVGVVGNLLVYPLFMWLIDRFNAKLWPYSFYKKGLIRFSRLAKKGMGNKLEKYGFWGLMVLVMVPLPGTGAYTGTIAAALFKVERKKAFLAISVGTLISCALMAAGAYLGILGWSLLK